MPVRDVESWSDDLHCAARHFSVAASQLARDRGLPPEEVARYAAAEALFRAQVDGRSGIGSEPIPLGPVVRLECGNVLPLTELLVQSCRQAQRWLPYRSIDSELVHGAREILCGLRWMLPDEVDPPGD